MNSHNVQSSNMERKSTVPSKVPTSKRAGKNESAVVQGMMTIITAVTTLITSSSAAPPKYTTSKRKPSVATTTTTRTKATRMSSTATATATTTSTSTVTNTEAFWNSVMGSVDHRGPYSAYYNAPKPGMITPLTCAAPSIDNSVLPNDLLQLALDNVDLTIDDTALNVNVDSIAASLAAPSLISPVLSLYDGGDEDFLPKPKSSSQLSGVGKGKGIRINSPSSSKKCVPSTKNGKVHKSSKVKANSSKARKGLKELLTESAALAPERVQVLSNQVVVAPTRAISGTGSDVQITPTPPPPPPPVPEITHKVDTLDDYLHILSQDCDRELVLQLKARRENFEKIITVESRELVSDRQLVVTKSDEIEKKSDEVEKLKEQLRQAEKQLREAKDDLQNCNQRVADRELRIEQVRKRMWLFNEVVTGQL